MPLEAPEKLPAMIAKIAKPGDFVVCLGAGSITNWANALPGDLEKLSAKKKSATAKSAKPKKGKGK